MDKKCKKCDKEQFRAYTLAGKEVKGVMITITYTECIKCGEIYGDEDVKGMIKLLKGKRF